MSRWYDHQPVLVKKYLVVLIFTYLENAQLDIVHAWQMPGECMLSSGCAKLPPGELQALLNRTEDKQQAILEVLLQPYGIAVDDENVDLVKGLPAKSIG